MGSRVRVRQGVGVCVFYHNTVCFASVRFGAFFICTGFSSLWHAAGIRWVLWKSDVFRESVFRKLCLFRLVYVKFKCILMFGL